VLEVEASVSKMTCVATVRIRSVETLYGDRTKMMSRQSLGTSNLHLHINEKLATCHLDSLSLPAVY
jgi:hypothetical protein